MNCLYFNGTMLIRTPAEPTSKRKAEAKRHEEVDHSHRDPVTGRRQPALPSRHRHGARRIRSAGEHRVKYNLDYDWKFIKQDVAGAETTAFNDAAWKDVSLPHHVQRHRSLRHVGDGERRLRLGGQDLVPANISSSMRRLPGGRSTSSSRASGRQRPSSSNGTNVGLHENGVGPIGVDVSSYVMFGGTDNVLAVKVDNNARLQGSLVGHRL